MSVAVKGIPLCGGSLITDHHVLTAAHCFFDKKTNRMVEPGSVLVVIGTHKIYDVDGFTKHVSAQQIYFTNPPFNMTSHQNDIAIIKLKEKVGLFPFNYYRPISRRFLEDPLSHDCLLRNFTLEI